MGAKMLECGKPPDLWGRLGYRDVSNVEEILVTGKVQAAWLKGLIDEASRKEWDEFVRTYDPVPDLPAWLRPKPAEPPK
jgi:hypothetical protein